MQDGNQIKLLHFEKLPKLNLARYSSAKIDYVKVEFRAEMVLKPIQPKYFFSSTKYNLGLNFVVREESFVVT